MSDKEFKLSIPLPEGWSDSSWHNDVLPSMINPDSTIQVMVDEADCYWMLSEYPNLEDPHRFTASTADEFDFVCYADSLEELLAKLKKEGYAV